MDARPKVHYFEKILERKDLTPIGTIAEDYGKSAQWMNRMLHKLRIQYHKGDIWYLYAEHRDKNYVGRHIGFAHGWEYNNLKWTQKGRYFIYTTLKDHGFIPLCEQYSPEFTPEDEAIMSMLSGE